MNLDALQVTPSHGSGKLPFVTVFDAIGDLPVLDNGARTDELVYKPLKELSEYQQFMRLGLGPHDSITGNIVTRNAPFVVERYRHIPQGGNWEDIPARLLGNYKDFARCHSGIYHRLSWHLPAKVIGNYRKNMLIHPEQHRGLSVREAARLQSFPDTYVVTGLIESQQQQVADAVPPLLSQAVASAILQCGSKHASR